MNTALLVIDMQKHFYKGESKENMDLIKKNVVKAINIFRSAKKPIIWIYHRNMKDDLYEGKDGFQFIEGFDQKENESKVIKEYGNGFKGTQLDSILNKNGIDNLVLCGYRAEGCVFATYSGAKKMKYKARILKDAIASSSKILMKLIEAINKTVQITEI